MLKQITSLQGIAQFSNELAQELRELTEKKGRLTTLEQDIRNGKDILSRQEREFRLLRSEVERLERDHKEKERDLLALRKQLETAERESRNMKKAA